MTKPTEAERLKRRKEAKKEVTKWWDDPSTEPTPEENELTRDGDISDPEHQHGGDE